MEAFVFFNSSFTFDIPLVIKDKTTPFDKKLASETELYRFSSPNYSAFFDFNPYMNTMYCTIKKNWHPTENSDAGKVVVSYKIKRDGTIIEPKVVSSTNKELNQSAIEAIEKSSPLQPLPKKCKKDLIEVSFTFNYNLE